MDAYRPVETHGNFSILLAAWPPPEHYDRRPGLVSPSLRHEAIVSVARAVFAAGGELVVTGDADVTPVIAAVALDYAPQPLAERREHPRSPLAVVESGGFDPTLRALMNPYIHHDAVLYLDADREPVERDRRWLGGELHEHRRHPLTRWVIERFDPRGAIVVSPDREALGEIEMLREFDVPVAVLASTVADQQLAEQFRELDPTERLIGDVRYDRWSERAPELRERPHEMVPYAFVVQRLIHEWQGRERPA
jgi:hypothetical protein